MNGVLIAVVMVILLGAFNGYRLGFLRVIYSLVSWILVFAFVTGATPYITKYIEEETSIQKTIEEKCLSYIEESAQKKAEEQAAEAIEVGEGKQAELKDLGIDLPEAVISRFSTTAAQTAGEVLENSGIYDEIAKGISHFIIEGIAFFVALVIISILSRYLLSILNLVSHLPVIHGINKILGIFVGLFKGLVIVWIAFYIIALCCTSELGGQLLTYIKEDTFLMYLYNNNLVLETVMRFL